MNLIDKVLSFVRNEHGVTLKEVYDHFKNERESSLRMTLYTLRNENRIHNINEWRVTQ